MRFNLPRPLRGWRALAGEVGIIVLGVLIALGAQQLVETLNQRSQLRELRAAVDQEIAYGVGTYDARLAQNACFEARLDELGQWLNGWREGRPQRLTGMISAPRSGPARTSVWASRDPDVMAHMPLPAKLAYGSIYDEFANNEVQRLDERMTWLELAEFDGAARLDEPSLMRLQGLITRARWRADNITGNARYIATLARGMGIRAVPDPFPADQLAAFCKPILAAGQGRTW
jgi:hypothetical protein